MLVTINWGAEPKREGLGSSCLHSCSLWSALFLTAHPHSMAVDTGPNEAPSCPAGKRQARMPNRQGRALWTGWGAADWQAIVRTILTRDKADVGYRVGPGAAGLYSVQMWV